MRASKKKAPKATSNSQPDDKLKFNLVERKKRKERCGKKRGPQEQFIFHLKLEDEKKSKKRARHNSPDEDQEDEDDNLLEDDSFSGSYSSSSSLNHQLNPTDFIPNAQASQLFSNVQQHSGQHLDAQAILGHLMRTPSSTVAIPSQETLPSSSEHHPAEFQHQFPARTAKPPSVKPDTKQRTEDDAVAFASTPNRWSYSPEECIPSAPKELKELQRYIINDMKTGNPSITQAFIDNYIMLLKKQKAEEDAASASIRSSSSSAPSPSITPSLPSSTAPQSTHKDPKQQFVDTIQQPTAIFAMNGRILSSNQRFSELFNDLPQAVCDKALQDWVHPNDMHNFHISLLQFLSSKKQTSPFYTMKMVLRDGYYADVTFNMQLNDDNFELPQNFVIMVHDYKSAGREQAYGGERGKPKAHTPIHDKILSTDELAFQLLDSLFGCMNSPTAFMYNTHGTILWNNDKFDAMFGVSDKALTGQNLVSTPSLKLSVFEQLLKETLYSTNHCQHYELRSDPLTVSPNRISRLYCHGRRFALKSGIAFLWFLTSQDCSTTASDSNRIQPLLRAAQTTNPALFAPSFTVPSFVQPQQVLELGAWSAKFIK